MDKPRIEKILEKCTPDEQLRVTTLYNGSIRAHKAYQAEPTAANLKDWEAAEAALVRLVEEIEARLYPADPPLKSGAAALRLLKDQGWKIEKSKFYKDIEKGLLRIQADKTVLAADLDSYVLRAALKRTAASDTGGKMERGQAEKLELENELLRKKLEDLDFKLKQAKQQYLKKSDVITEFALKMAVIEATLKHWIRTGAADLVYAVGGDPAKARVLINLFEARLDEMLDEMSRIEELEIEIKRTKKLVLKTGEVELNGTFTIDDLVIIIEELGKKEGGA